MVPPGSNCVGVLLDMMVTVVGTSRVVSQCFDCEELWVTLDMMETKLKKGKYCCGVSLVLCCLERPKRVRSSRPCLNEGVWKLVLVIG